MGTLICADLFTAPANTELLRRPKELFAQGYFGLGLPRQNPRVLQVRADDQRHAVITIEFRDVVSAVERAEEGDFQAACTRARSAA